MRAVVWLCLVGACCACPCPANEICLRNRTCHCPFFKLGDTCVRRRFQTTVNATLDALQAARHLLSAPLMLTVDSTNYEAMQALSASLAEVANIGTVVTRVVDSMDTLVGGEPTATMEISNISILGLQTNITVEYRLPLVDFFFFYLHFGASIPPCPPFDITNACCRGSMGPEFRTVSVDCTGDAMAQMDAFIDAWKGVRVGDNMFRISVDLTQVPAEEGNRFRFGVGMVVFGRLAQNTETRVDIQINTSTTVASTGCFQYSFVEDVRLQVEAYGSLYFARLLVKASGVSSVQSLRYATSDGGDLLLPNCTSANRSSCGGAPVWVGCNVTIDAEYLEIIMPLPRLTPVTLVYALLAKGATLTRVLAKTDDTVLQHCNEVIEANAHAIDAFTVEVLQRGQTMYAGPAQLVNLTDVALLTLRLHSLANDTSFRFDNISVVYSLVDASLVLARMPNNKVTPELEALCQDGSVCIIETLLLNGVCQTDSKCEWQADDLVVMPLYPWGEASLGGGAYTVMLTEIKEFPLVPIARRLMGWWQRLFRR